MPRSSKPRKKYRPKEVNKPVTKGLYDEIGELMHFAMMALKCGSNDVTLFRRVGLNMAAIAQAAEWQFGSSSTEERRLAGGLSAMYEVIDRFERTGKWHLPEKDHAAVASAIRAAETLVARLRFGTLRRSYMEMLALERQLQEEAKHEPALRDDREICRT